MLTAAVEGMHKRRGLAEGADSLESRQLPTMIHGSTEHGQQLAQAEANGREETGRSVLRAGKSHSLHPLIPRVLRNRIAIAESGRFA